MQVIVPTEIDIKSTTVAVNSEGEWSALTTYGLDDLVKVTTEAPNKVYKSLRGNNTGRNPSDSLEAVTEVSSSATSLTIGVSSHSLTIEAGKSFSAGMIVTIAKTVTPSSVNMKAEVTSYNSGTGTMVVSAYSVSGSGEHAGWTVSSADEIGFWVEVESTNQWKMFDSYVNTQTVDTDVIEVKLNVSSIDHIVLLNVDAVSVELSLWSGNEAVKFWSKTVDMVYGSSLVAIVSDWYEYFFGEYSLKTSVSESAGIAVYDSVFVIRINANEGEEAKCGTCIVGRAVEIGKTQYGVSAGMIDYSYRSEDTDTGAVSITQGYWAKRNTMTVSLDNVFFDYVYNTITGLRGTPTAWIGNNESTEYESLLVYGIVKDFEITVPGPTKSYATIEIEGLI